ncbi:protein shisa-5 [Sceloporus undulatus]|uniref:protein shisa-5 n=1 Tax=Sceloporus undulatus TaxID=8520 RepID=UPI001C4C9B6F|nr:protein shisa-5 [Sceloporus undulatus]
MAFLPSPAPRNLWAFGTLRCLFLLLLLPGGGFCENCETYQDSGGHLYLGTTCPDFCCGNCISRYCCSDLSQKFDEYDQLMCNLQLSERTSPPVMGVAMKFKSELDDWHPMISHGPSFYSPILYMSIEEKVPLNSEQDKLSHLTEMPYRLKLCYCKYQWHFGFVAGLENSFQNTVCSEFYRASRGEYHMKVNCFERGLPFLYLLIASLALLCFFIAIVTTTTATTVVQVPYPQQPGMPAGYPAGVYQGYSPVPVQPQPGMPAAPYPTQYPPPYHAQPAGPPPYHETMAAGAGAPATQPPYNPAYMDPTKPY